MKLLQHICLLATLTTTSAFAFGAGKPVPTVDYVDLNSYAGLWYEIQRVENDFQDIEKKEGDGVCYNTTAEYTLLPNEKIKVVNTCYRLSSVEVAQAKGKVVEDSGNAKLKVNFTGIPILEFLGIGNGDYWILALGPKNESGLYSWVLVGSPTIKYGWILSRTPNLGAAQIETALQAAEAAGYSRDQFKSFRR